MTHPPADRSITPREAAQVLAILDTVAKDVKAKLNAARSIAASSYFAPGDRVTVLDPTDPTRKLGSVWMTSPEPVAEITDEAALLAHLEQEDPTAVERAPVLVSTDCWDEVLDVLREHAPHLIRDTPFVKGWAREAAKKAALAGDLSPGIEVRTKPGVMTTKIDEAGKRRLGELVTSGQLDPLPALPSAPTDEAAG